jgi:type IV secretion system protein VirB7
MLKALILSTLMAFLAGCSSVGPLAACKGPVFQLNAGYWQPSPADLKKPTFASDG